jgi:hypothetical protein
MRHYPWLKHGFWNTLEHALIRVSDAFVSMLLLWILSPEFFSQLALAQAAVSPFLILFIAPENLIYRDYARWKESGPEAIAARLRVFRLFAWGKWQFAVLISGVMAWYWSDSRYFHVGKLNCFLELVWAFSLVMAPQVSGPDREFLRLDLRLKEVNALGVFQKLSLVAGTVIAVYRAPGQIGPLTTAVVLSTALTALLARWRVVQALGARHGQELPLAPVIVEVFNSMRQVSFWQHLSGVILNWVQTMDMLFLGMFGFAARAVGLYAAALKIANVSIALPTALANLFSIWLGRRGAQGKRGEIGHLKRLSLMMLAVNTIQAVVIWELSPWLIHMLSHGRWSDFECAEVRAWLTWILAGAALLGAALPVSSWLVLRARVSKVFYQVYLPWGLMSAAIYFLGILASSRAGLTGPMAAAMANVLVSVVFLMLLASFVKSYAGVESR